MIERLKKLPKKLSATGAESGPIAICAPGPSLRETWEAASAFPVVMAVKSAHDFLIEKGVTPNFAVTKDDLPRVIGRSFRLAPHAGVSYVAGGREGAKSLGAIKPKFLDIHHNDLQKMGVRDPYMYKILRTRGSGGFALMCAYVMGFRELHLFGYDNCFKDGLKRANGFVAQTDTVVELSLKGRTFYMNGFLERELRYIRNFKASMPGVKLIPHGDGVLSHIWKQAG